MTGNHTALVECPGLPGVVAAVKIARDRRIVCPRCQGVFAAEQTEEAA